MYLTRYWGFGNMDWFDIIKAWDMYPKEAEVKMYKKLFQESKQSKYDWQLIHLSPRRGSITLTLANPHIYIVGTLPKIATDVSDEVKERLDNEDYEDAKNLIKEQFKPTLVSLDWFVDVVKGSERMEFENEDLRVYGESGKEYVVNLNSPKASGCYNLQTEEGYDICIDINERKPMGDNILSLALALANDETAAPDIDGIDDYLSGQGYIDCVVCQNYFLVNFEYNEDEHQCDNCGVENVITHLSFEPRFSPTVEVYNIDGPFGTVYPPDAYAGGDLFMDGNAVFRIGEEEDYYLAVRDDASRELTEVIEDVLYVNDGELFDRDGDELNFEEIINSAGYDVMNTIVERTNYNYNDLYEILGFEYLAGNLWTDGMGGFFSASEGPFDFDIENILYHSELEEEEFIMEAMERWDLDEMEVMPLFNYEEDGLNWTKDGIKYELIRGEVLQIDDKEITKHLSSKALLPINMKWTDYLKKSSGENLEDWETALKSFISDGKKLGVPLSVMELLKLAKEATTSQSEGFETLHRPTFSEEEEEDV